jgi:hypothetical protein
MKPEDLLLADVLDFRPDRGTIRLQEQRLVILRDRDGPCSGRSCSTASGATPLVGCCSASALPTGYICTP